MRAVAPLAAARAIEGWAGLDPIADPITEAVRAALPAGPVKDALSGRWIGHALHPLLSDVPIGFWASAVVLDLFGGPAAAPAADRLIGLGILAAVPTSLAGISDWGDTQPKERRVGIVHGVANLAATALYWASLAARRRGRRKQGVALSLTATGALGLGGYLGGHLVFARGLGVDRTVFESRPEEWADAGAADEIQEGCPVGASVGGVAIVLARHDGELFALADRCTHRGAPLHEGPQEAGCIVCPWHQSVFRLADGAVVQGPATTPAPRLETRVRDGRVEVRVPQEQLD